MPWLFHLWNISDISIATCNSTWSKVKSVRYLAFIQKPWRGRLFFTTFFPLSLKSIGFKDCLKSHFTLIATIKSKTASLKSKSTFVNRGILKNQRRQHKFQVFWVLIFFFIKNFTSLCTIVWYFFFLGKSQRHCPWLGGRGHYFMCHLVGSSDFESRLPDCARLWSTHCQRMDSGRTSFLVSHH